MIFLKIKILKWMISDFSLKRRKKNKKNPDTRRRRRLSENG